MASTPASTARTAPLSLGTRAAYCVPGRRRILAITVSASRSWGTAFGWTNDVTSMRGTPASDKRSTTSIFRSVGMNSGSIWNPSRVPTSQSVTCAGSFMQSPRAGWRRDALTLANARPPISELGLKIAAGGRELAPHGPTSVGPDPWFVQGEVADHRRSTIPAEARCHLPLRVLGSQLVAAGETLAGGRGHRQLTRPSQHAGSIGHHGGNRRLAGAIEASGDGAVGARRQHTRGGRQQGQARGEANAACYRGVLEVARGRRARAHAARRPPVPAWRRRRRIPGKEALIAVSPGPRLVRWAIAIITAFFVVMMFSPLVQEIVRRISVGSPMVVP